MYRYSNGQISLSDFQQPMGMRLREDNRWVKKAQSIPWDKIEEKYADLFPSETGNVAKPLQLALGACLIQREYGYSDVETVLQIQENPYLQYFCGYAGYDDSKLPFDASSMVHFRKRLTPEVLAQINEMVIQEAQKTEDNDNQDDNKPDGGGNSGTIIVDATCAPSNIRYPQDVSLLNEARENAEKLLDILHSPTDGKKPRTYRKRARKDYLKYVRCRKHTAKMTRKAIGKQLNYLKRDLAAIDGKLNQEKALNIHQTERLETIRKIYEQQKYMYDNHTHSVENRIVSVSQPFVRPIVRGKVGKPVEFGMKLDISVTDGWTRLEYRSFDAYNEATKLQEMIENFHKREGHYPSRVLADKIYRNRENLSYCKARGIRLSGPALGRPKKGEDRNKAQDYRDECERVEVERKFSLGKRKCGMGLVTAKLEETAAHVVALSILLLNLRKIQCAFLQFLDWLLGLLQSREKRMVIQWTLNNEWKALGLTPPYSPLTTSSAVHAGLVGISSRALLKAGIERNEPMQQNVALAVSVGKDDVIKIKLPGTPEYIELYDSQQYSLSLDEQRRLVGLSGITGSLDIVLTNSNADSNTLYGKDYAQNHGILLLSPTTYAGVNSNAWPKNNENTNFITQYSQSNNSKIIGFDYVIINNNSAAIEELSQTYTYFDQDFEQWR